MLLGPARAEVVRFARRLRPDRLVVGTSGNLSVRVGELLAVSPSGLDYDELTPDLVGVHRLDGSPVMAELEPTSELPMHLAVYRDTDAGAVVHTHSTAATVLSTLVTELPAVHYLVGLFGGPVRVAPYATYGTEELAAGMLAALAGRTGCLLGNHGALTVGETLRSAYSRAVYLEWLCEVYLRAAAAPAGMGPPKLLDPDEIARVTEKLSRYGQEPPTP